MNLSNPELETVLRCVDKVFDFSAERDRLRDLLATLEAENKALRAAGDALARHVAGYDLGRVARRLVEAWAEVSR